MENGLEMLGDQALSTAQLVRGIGIKELVTMESAKALRANNVSVAPPGVAATGTQTYYRDLAEQATIKVDIDGAHYDAHMLDDGTVCIDACATQRAELVMPDRIEGCDVTRLAPRVCAKAPDLVALVLPANTREVGEHAFDRCVKLEAVALSQSIERIGGYAFSNTLVSEFDAPPSLREIGPKTFFHCERLTAVNLNEGLASIGEGAFSGSGIRSLRIPASACKLGRDLVKETPIASERPFGMLAFEEGSPFVADAWGGIYRKVSKGLVLLEMANPHIVEYAVLPGTVRIADRAFLYHAAIVHVVLPDGLEAIGNAAFKFCRQLRYVDVPDSLASLGEEAFRSSALESFRLPGRFSYLGMYGLSTCSRGSTLSQPTLRYIDIDPANEIFYLESGLLCRRDEEGDHAIVYVGPQTDVAIPKQVLYIDGFCFGGVDNIKHLTVHTDVLSVGLGAFFISVAIPRVTILTRDVDGVERQYEAYFPTSQFPSSSYSGQCFSQAFGGPVSAGIGDEDTVPRGKTPDGIVRKDSSVMDPATIFAFADLSIRHCYQTEERTGLILLRLYDGQFLDEVGREMFVNSVYRHLEEFVISCSKQGYVNFIHILVELGFINEGNISRIIDLLGENNDVKLVSYLLNVQHERFASTRAVVEDL